MCWLQIYKGLPRKKCLSLLHTISMGRNRLTKMFLEVTPTGTLVLYMNGNGNTELFLFYFIFCYCSLSISAVVFHINVIWSILILYFCLNNRTCEQIYPTYLSPRKTTPLTLTDTSASKITVQVGSSASNGDKFKISLTVKDTSSGRWDTSYTLLVINGYTAPRVDVFSNFSE